MVTDQPAAEARAVIAQLHAAGLGSFVIARRLNADGVPTPSGRGRWHPATVRRHAHPEAWTAYMRDYRARGRQGYVPRQQGRAW